ncbi:MAG: hypothetical protein K8J31_13985 [Anaerolineae bacterium]|nr:hypothetical protein [Anaerolineae bacterium]
MSTAAFLNIPAYDHIRPTLSVAAELVRRGEHVIYYASEPFRESIEATGAVFRAYEGLPDNLLSETNPLMLSVRMADSCRLLLPGLIAELNANPADYLIYDSRCAWGWYAARILDLPAISSMTLMMLNSTVLIRSGKLFPTLRQTLESLPLINAYRNILLELEQTYGVTGPGVTDILNLSGPLTICYTSEQFQPDAASFGGSVKFVGPADVPAVMATRTGDQPLVVCNGICTVPEYAAALAGGNWQVRQVDRTSLADTLPQASLCVTSGVMSTVQLALYCDVPLIVVPQTIEQSLVGQQVASLGAGVQIDELTPAHLRSAVEIVLANDHFRQAAASIGQSLRAAGGYARAADEILAFTQAYSHR